MHMYVTFLQLQSKTLTVFDKEKLFVQVFIFLWYSKQYLVAPVIQNVFFTLVFPSGLSVIA